MYKRQGNGFTFASYNAHDMLHVIREACGVFRFNKPAWSKLIMQGMQLSLIHIYRLRGGVYVLPPYESKKTEWYKGTANAIYQNIQFLEDYDPEYVLILDVYKRQASDRTTITNY